MIQALLVHHICNTAVHKMWPKLHTSQFWPLSLEVSSHFLISSPLVPPLLPWAISATAGLNLSHGKFQCFCPVEECYIQHGFDVVLRAVYIYTYIQWHSFPGLYCMWRLTLRHIIQGRHFHRQESRRISALCSKMYSKSLALKRQQQWGWEKWMLEGGQGSLCLYNIDQTWIHMAL